MAFDFTHSTGKALEVARQVMLQSDPNYTGSEYQIAIDAEIERRKVAAWEAKRPNRVITAVLAAYARTMNRRAEVAPEAVGRIAGDLLDILESEGYGDIRSFEVPIPVVGRPRIDIPVGEAVKIFEDTSAQYSDSTGTARGILAVLTEVAHRHHALQPDTV